MFGDGRYARGMLPPSARKFCGIERRTELVSGSGQPPAQLQGVGSGGGVLAGFETDQAIDLVEQEASRDGTATTSSRNHVRLWL